MMNQKIFGFATRLAAASFVLAPALAFCSQTSGHAGSKAAEAAPAAPAPPSVESQRAQAYYHAALAGLYEDQAVNEGHPEQIANAIEQYKLALKQDPDSASLNDELADLYFRTGREQEAESMLKKLLVSSPGDVPAHKLLGRIYLRRLGEQQSGVSSSSPAGNTLDLAIAQFEKICALQPDDVQDRMVLGQLYTVKHQPDKAEAAFKSAQAIQPDSEDVVLNLARIYAENGNLQQAMQVIQAVPEGARTPKMEFMLGAAYDQLKDSAKAIAAYKRAAQMDPQDLQTIDALAQALTNDKQYDEALKEYRTLSQADPENSEALVHICEILRRQGKYEDALAAARKARSIDPTSLEAGYNEGMLLDVLGRLDDSAKTYRAMVDQLSHANGAYTTAEKSNRSIFLARLGAVEMEANKTDQAVAAYQKMIDMGGDAALQGYQGQVDAYRTAHEFNKSLAVAKKAAAADPKNKDVQLMLAGELADHGQVEQAMSLAKAQLNGTAADRSVYFAIAQIDVRLKHWKDAEAALDKAEPLATKKDDKIYLLFLRGEVAERQKHLSSAERYFRQVLSLDPQNAMTLNYLGYMLADKGERLPEAVKLIQQAVALEPWNGAYLDSLGWAYFKMGDYELSENNLLQAVQRDQTDPTVHMHLGDLYEKTGRIRQAAAQWQMSLADFAKSSPADVNQSDVNKVQKKLESARVKLAKQDASLGQKPE